MYERAPIVHCALSENGVSHQHRYQEEYSTHFSFFCRPPTISTALANHPSVRSTELARAVMMEEEAGTPVRTTTTYKIASGMGSGTSFGSNTVDSPLQWETLGFTRKDSKRRDRAATLEKPQFSNQLFSLATPPGAGASTDGAAGYIDVVGGAVAGGAAAAAANDPRAPVTPKSSGGWVTPEPSSASSSASAAAERHRPTGAGTPGQAGAASPGNAVYRDLTGVQIEAETLRAGGSSGAGADEAVPDISMMGSTLLGGANCDLSPGQRQEYIDGISVRARFVGSVVVPSANGHAMVLSAITRIRAQQKMDFGKKRKPKRKFTMSTRGLRIYLDETGVLEHDYKLTSISFIGVLPSNTKVFAFISSAHTPSGVEHTCHVYKTNKKTKLITNTLGVCFTLAVELERARVASELELAGTPRPQSASSVFDRDARMSRRASMSSRMPTDFYGIVAAIRDRLTASAASTADTDFAGHGLAKLIGLYEAAVQRGGGGGGGGRLRSPLARSASDEKAALERQHDADVSKATAVSSGESGHSPPAAPAYTAASPAVPAAAMPPPAFSDAPGRRSPSPGGGQRIAVQPACVSTSAVLSPHPPSPAIGAATPGAAAAAAAGGAQGARTALMSPLPPARSVLVSGGARYDAKLGLLIKSFKGVQGVWVQAVAPGQCADKTGQIFVGDLLSSIDGVPVHDWDYSQVASRLGATFRRQPTLELGFLSPTQLGLAGPAAARGSVHEATSGAGTAAAAAGRGGGGGVHGHGHGRSDGAKKRGGGSRSRRTPSEADAQPLFSDE